MALPHKEWRAYLDKILDSYMRTNVTTGAVGYMIDRMEEIFSEYLVTVPEHSPNSVYPLDLDPLQTFLTHPDVRSVIPMVPPGSTGVEEKWVVRREIMEYIKGVVELSSLKVLKNGPRSRMLPTVKCWLSDERARQPSYMEPAILTRKAKRETPLKPHAFRDALTPKRKYGATKSNRLASPNSNQKRLPSQKRDPFFTSTLGKGLKMVPVRQETISQEESEKLLMPKLSIPRTTLDVVWTCIKASPFSSGLKNTVSIVGHQRSERVMTTFDGGEIAAGTSLGGRISPPLFPRNTDARQRNSHSTNVAANGIEVLKDTLKPAFMDIDMETQEEDRMENMRIAEGWPTIPFDFGTSSTPPMTSDRSQGSGKGDDEDENVLQIDELMLPSSPPFGNKELKELFRTRMDEILLPRKEYPFSRLGGVQSSMADRQTSDYPNDTLSTTIRDTLHLSAASQTGVKAQEGLAATASKETHEKNYLDPDIGEVLDELCRSVKGLDKYSAITKDTLEDIDGMFLPVPSLPPPSQGIITAALPDVVRLSKPFETLPLRDVFMALNLTPRPSPSVRLVEPAKGVTRLKLELSWQAFVYRGPIISHETLCEVHRSPFHTSQSHRDDVEWKSNAPTMRKANQLLEVLAATCEAEDNDLFRVAFWEGNDAHSSSRRELEDGWSGDTVLLLTRAEVQRSKGLSATHYTPVNRGEAPAMDKPDLGEDSRSMIKAKSQYGAGEYPAMELFSENLEDMVLDKNPLPPDDKPQYEYQSEANPSPYFQREAGPFLYSQHAISVSAVDTDGHGIVGSGSSHGYESAIGTSRTPIANHFSYFQRGGEEMAPFVDDDMGLESLDAPPTEFDFTPLITNNMKNSPSLPDFQTSHHRNSFSNIDLLQDFLAHRAATGFQYASHHAEGTLALGETTPMIEDSFGIRTESLSEEAEWPTLPPELLSKVIFLPEQWSVPSTRHRYLASLPFLQRRALVQKLKADCSVDLSEVHDAMEADLIVDTHTAVRLITVSDLVPTTFDALTSSIVGLGYGFTRILIVLEAYPFSRSTLSAQKLESSHWEGLKMITQTVVSTFTRLRRTAMIGLGMLEGPDDQDVAEDLGNVQLEFALSWSPDDTVRLVRCMGDYAESVVSDWERNQLWGPRLWLEASQDVKNALRYSKYRGMNTFAALAVASVMSLPDFVELSLSEKLISFGRLVGDTRMVGVSIFLYDQRILNRLSQKLFHRQAQNV